MSWKNPPTNFAVQVLADGDAHLRKIAAEMLQGVIMSSPVMDGTFRSNHRVSIDGPTSETVASTGNKAPKGTIDQATFDDGKSEILKAHLGSSVYIQNNLPYAVRLENGWSDQAPKGIYALTYLAVTSKYK